jgi:hypothetical protein
MKITRESWLKATAEAMSMEASKKLFKDGTLMEDLFTEYSFSLFQILSGKTLNHEEFIDAVEDFGKEILSETDMKTTTVLVKIALMVFANQIWESMIKLTESDHLNSEYENFKSVLKSQKSE